MLQLMLLFRVGDLKRECAHTQISICVHASVACGCEHLHVLGCTYVLAWTLMVVHLPIFMVMWASEWVPEHVDEYGLGLYMYICALVSMYEYPCPWTCTVCVWGLVGCISCASMLVCMFSMDAFVYLCAYGVSLPLITPQEAPRQVQTTRNKGIICII